MRDLPSGDRKRAAVPFLRDDRVAFDGGVLRASFASFLMGYSSGVVTDLPRETQKDRIRG